MKRLIAQSLAIALAVSSLPLSAAAAEVNEDTVTTEAESSVASDASNEASKSSQQSENTEEAAEGTKADDASIDAKENAEEASVAESAEETEEIKVAEEEVDDEANDEVENPTASKLEIAGDTYYYIVKTDDLTEDTTIALDKDEAGEDVTTTFADFTEVDGAGLYYYTTANVAGNLYGYTTTSYSDLYQGQTSASTYDAVASATTKKNTLFASTDVSEVTENGYYIYGLKCGNVAVSKSDYVKAALLQEANLLDNEAYENILNITLNEQPEDAPSYYIPYDGVSFKPVVIRKRIVVHDATGDVSYFSRYGTYLLRVTETSTNYLRKSRDNDIYPVNNSLHGAIIRGTDSNGNPVSLGMRHLKEIWVSPYEIAFDPDTNAAASFEGGTITSVDYLTATDVYTYKFEEPVSIKATYNTDSLKTYFNKKDNQLLTISGFDTALSNSTLTLSYKEGRSTIAVVDGADVTIENGAINYKVDAELIAETTYTVTIKSDEFADIILTVTPETIDGEDEEAPTEPTTPEEPVVPETPDTPEVPETPTTPDVPVAPENPDVSKLIPGFEPTKEQTAIFNEIDRQLNEVVIPAAVKYFNLATDVIPQIKNHLYVIQQHIIRFFFGK